MTAHDPAWEELWAAARKVDMLDVAARLGAKLRRAGADHIGPCPAGCASTDGFVLTPGKGIFLCRPSGESGDVVDMVVHCAGLTKAAALEFVTGRDLPGKREETAEERQERERRRAKQQADAEARRRREEKGAADKRRRDEEAVADVLRRAVPIAGTHAEAYLRARGLTPQRRLTGDLRFVVELDYWGFAKDGDDKRVHLATLPAMVAVVRNVTGAMIGIHQTFLDPAAPRKWRPTGSRENKPKKIRGEAKGGMIRLGMLGDKLALAEGIETSLSWHALGYGPDDISLAAAISLGNMAGGCTGSLPHPTAIGPNGKPVMIRNGIPDVDKPGVVLPDDVRELILLGDGDSDRHATRAAVATASRRFMSEGRVVAVHMAPSGLDWNDVLTAQRADEENAA